jgi:hypothetical protein
LNSKNKNQFVFKAVLVTLFFIAGHPYSFFGFLLDDQEVKLVVDPIDADEDIFIQGDDGSGSAQVTYQEESRNENEAKGSLKVKQPINPIVLSFSPNLFQPLIQKFLFTASILSLPPQAQEFFHPPQS